MRRPVLISLLLAGVLALGACGDSQPKPTDGATGTTGTAGTSGEGLLESAEGMPTVAAGFGEQPVVAFPNGAAPTGLQRVRLHEGTGEEVGQGDFIVADYIGQVWGADTPFNDTWDMGYPIGFSLKQVVQGWSQGIPGARVGDRIMLSIPSALGYPDGNPDAGIAAGDTLVFVIDILSAHPEGSWFGQADARDTGKLAELPVTVDGAFGSRPTGTVTAGSPEPTEVTATVVGEGSGAPVGEKQTVVLAYHIAAWDGTDGGSTWDEGAPRTMMMGAGSVFDTLVGVPVGSRVVILVPAGADFPSLAIVVEVLAAVD